MRRHGWQWAFVVVLGLGIARTSAAQSSADDAALANLLRSGATAAKSKSWPACIDAYTQAVALDEDPITFGELGLCEEAAGRYASAHPHLKRATAGLAPSHPRRARYQAALGHVAEQVAVVFLTVSPPEARVVVDGLPLGRGDGQNVAVMPGRHVFSARHPGYEDRSEPITVNACEMPNVDLSLEPKPAPPPPPSVASGTAAAEAAPSVPLPPAEAPVSRFSRFLCMPGPSARGAIGPLACAGAAALLWNSAMAIGFEVDATSMRNGLLARGFDEHTCAPGQPTAGSADCTELTRRGENRAVTRDVLIGTGVVAGVVAVGLGVAIALEPRGPHVQARVSANGGGIALEGSW